ncbi:site-specific integrase [Acidipila sp. EB88]|uniref:tyrosine-type recombinase/integrase n=1 Tax=Acidipila sp. EB88 TaxID=2305226 RepID=UPI000F5FF140|nr:site-specific integrase [Acidipila sp. EB88]
MLVGCGLRRAELSALTVEDLQIRRGHWAIVDLVGKGNHVRTVPMPVWVKGCCRSLEKFGKGDLRPIFRAISQHRTPWGTGISENVIWYVVRRVAKRMQMDGLAPHDLRRTCAKLCHVNGGELEQIQFLLGHVSVLTTERYLGCKQNLEKPVNDRLPLRSAMRGITVRPVVISRETGIKAKLTLGWFD